MAEESKPFKQLHCTRRIPFHVKKSSVAVVEFILFQQNNKAS